MSTKVSLRLALTDVADVIPQDVLDRLRQQQHWRITRADDLIVHCDEERTQEANRKLAFARLQSMVDDATVVPKEYISRQISETPQRVKERRLREKKQHQRKKQARSSKWDG